MATTEEWIDELKSISVLELSERIKALEETFGVTRRGPRGRRGAPAGGGGGGPRPRRRRPPSTSASTGAATRRSR